MSYERQRNVGLYPSSVFIVDLYTSIIGDYLFTSTNISTFLLSLLNFKKKQ